jgi:hypothetical protein
LAIQSDQVAAARIEPRRISNLFTLTTLEA